jgi:hypothetical protein
MQPPSTVTQLVLVVVCVLPGVTYQFVRERARGPVPGETDLGHRLLRALTASIVLDGIYLAVLGRNLVEMLRPDRFPGDPRGTALYALVLLFGVPASSAAVLSWRERRRLRGRYRATPTAWDHMFRDRGPSYVRARLKDGTWVGGWYGETSFATSYPQPAELYLQSSYRMSADGSFLARVEATDGLYLRAEDVDVIELLAPPRAVAARGERNQGESGS